MRWNTYAAGTKLPAQQTGHEQIDRLRRAGITTGVFWMVIPYTTPELTRAALRHAEVCSDLDVQISLVDIQVVPFPYPLDQPPINREFSEQRLRELLKQSGLPGQAGQATCFIRETGWKPSRRCSNRDHWSSWPRRNVGGPRERKDSLVL